MHKFGPVTQELLNRYAQASGDKNPIHLVEKIALDSGLPGVIAHGMLIAAWVNEAIGRSGFIVQDLVFRFRGMTFLKDVILVEVAQDGDKVRAHARTDGGRVVCTATAWFTSDESAAAPSSTETPS